MNWYYLHVFYDYEYEYDYDVLAPSSVLFAYDIWWNWKSFYWKISQQTRTQNTTTSF